MNFQDQLLLLNESSDDLLTAIENKSWDIALHYSHEWSTCLRNLFKSLSSEQLVQHKVELSNLVKQHEDIKTKISYLRAKTLTQLKEINNSHILNQHYNK